MEHRVTNSAFNKLNPAAGFAFFALVISFTMLFMNPVTSVISFGCAFINALYINGKKALSLSLKFILPTAVTFAVLNPLLNHEGATIITYLPSGNPMTAEAMFFGAVSAITLGAVTLWFSVFHTIMTSDKFVYLFGRISPSLSLLLSMTLKFLPQLVRRLKEVREFDKINGKNTRLGLKQRISHVVSQFSAVITWALESSIITSESMKSRGYGLKGRTSYSIYRIRKDDIVMLCATVLTAVLLIIFRIYGAGYFRYYPTFRLSYSDALSQVLYAALLLYMLAPFIINIREEISWKKSQSTI